jgi:toxin-antitoxin system PIN domain toxin
VLLTDVNVLVSAYREDALHHRQCHAFVEEMVNGQANYGFTDIVLSGFLRVVTHPRVFAVPSPFGHALTFVSSLRDQPNARQVMPGDRHWSIFCQLCEDAGAKGNLVPDAYLAALAIEQGCDWITLDRDFSRFPGLTWRSPLKSGRS